VRYLAPDSPGGRALSSVIAPEIGFNYLGQLEQGPANASMLRFVGEPTASQRSPAARRVNSIDIDSMVVGGSLQVRWTFSRNLHRRATIAGAAHTYLAALRELIEHCMRAGSHARTPADFPLAGLSSGELADLLNEISNSE
jgi:non-ribosomal peptide synthase protein (TIGR01720 family)